MLKQYHDSRKVAIAGLICKPVALDVDKVGLDRPYDELIIVVAWEESVGEQIISTRIGEHASIEGRMNTVLS